MYKDASDEVIDSIIEERPNTLYTESTNVNLFTMSTDGVSIVLYLVKLACGIAFVKASICPPDKEFEYKYDTYVGDIRWEIRLAK